jgi:hypothetical protein
MGVNKQSFKCPICQTSLACGSRAPCLCCCVCTHTINMIGPLWITPGSRANVCCYCFDRQHNLCHPCNDAQPFSLTGFTIQNLQAQITWPALSLRALSAVCSNWAPPSDPISKGLGECIHNTERSLADIDLWCPYI